MVEISFCSASSSSNGHLRNGDGIWHIYDGILKSVSHGYLVKGTFTLAFTQNSCTCIPHDCNKPNLKSNKIDYLFRGNSVGTKLSSRQTRSPTYKVIEAAGITGQGTIVCAAEDCCKLTATSRTLQDKPNMQRHVNSMSQLDSKNHT